MRTRKLSLILLVILIGILMFSCGIGTTKIGDIVSNPREFSGKEVTVSGRVIDTFSLFVVRYYTLQDDTGQIAIVTDRPLPAQGEKMKTKGIVKEAFSIGTKSILVIVESAQTRQ